MGLGPSPNQPAPTLSEPLATPTLNSPSETLLPASAPTTSRNTGTLTVNGNEYVGYNATGSGPTAGGTFTQTGGTNNVAGQVNIGFESGATGLYTLSSGTLTTPVGIVGDNATGTFNQTGGTANFTAASPAFTLFVGSRADGRGTYSLPGTGVINTAIEMIAHQSTGAGSTPGGLFIQNGGTNNASAFVFLADLTGSVGAYQLTNGSLVTENLNVGLAGNGTFTHTGGNATIGTTAAYQGHLYITQVATSNHREWAEHLLRSA